MSNLSSKTWFRCISLVLIHAFLIMDIAWAGGTELNFAKNTDTLAAPLEITQQMFNASFSKLYEMNQGSDNFNTALISNSDSAVNKPAKAIVIILGSVLFLHTMPFFSHYLTKSHSEILSKYVQDLSAKENPGNKTTFHNVESRQVEKIKIINTQFIDELLKSDEQRISKLIGSLDMSRRETVTDFVFTVVNRKLSIGRQSKLLSNFKILDEKVLSELINRMDKRTGRKGSGLLSESARVLYELRSKGSPELGPQITDALITALNHKSEIVRSFAANLLFWQNSFPYDYFIKGRLYQDLYTETFRKQRWVNIWGTIAIRGVDVDEKIHNKLAKYAIEALSHKNDSIRKSAAIYFRFHFDTNNEYEAELHKRALKEENILKQLYDLSGNEKNPEIKNELDKTITFLIEKMGLFTKLKYTFLIKYYAETIFGGFLFAFLVYLKATAKKRAAARVLKLEKEKYDKLKKMTLRERALYIKNSFKKEAVPNFSNHPAEFTDYDYDVMRRINSALKTKDSDALKELEVAQLAKKWFTLARSKGMKATEIREFLLKAIDLKADMDVLKFMIEKEIASVGENSETVIRNRIEYEEVIVQEQITETEDISRGFYLFKDIIVQEEIRKKIEKKIPYEVKVALPVFSIEGVKSLIEKKEKLRKEAEIKEGSKVDGDNGLNLKSLLLPLLLTPALIALSSALGWAGDGSLEASGWTLSNLAQGIAVFMGIGFWYLKSNGQEKRLASLRKKRDSLRMPTESLETLQGQLADAMSKESREWADSNSRFSRSARILAEIDTYEYARKLDAQIYELNQALNLSTGMKKSGVPIFLRKIKANKFMNNDLSEISAEDMARQYEDEIRTLIEVRAKKSWDILSFGIPHASKNPGNFEITDVNVLQAAKMIEKYGDFDAQLLANFKKDSYDDYVLGEPPYIVRIMGLEKMNMVVQKEAIKPQTMNMIVQKRSPEPVIMNMHRDLDIDTVIRKAGELMDLNESQEAMTLILKSILGPEAGPRQDASYFRVIGKQSRQMLGYMVDGKVYVKGLGTEYKEELEGGYNPLIHDLVSFGNLEYGMSENDAALQVKVEQLQQQATAYFVKGEFEKTIEIIKGIIKIYPNSIEVMHMMIKGVKEHMTSDAQPEAELLILDAGEIIDLTGDESSLKEEINALEINLRAEEFVLQAI